MSPAKIEAAATITDKAFQELIAKRGRALLSLANCIVQHKSPHKMLVRPFLGELLSQSMQMSELLDAYGARNNRRWGTFRSLTSAIKLFSDVSYDLLNIQHASSAYHLLPIEHNFTRATQQALAFTGDVLLRAAGSLLEQAHQIGLPVPAQNYDDDTYGEKLPPGRLPHDHTTRRVETVSETVTLLATAFLNLAAESESICAAGNAKPDEYAEYISNCVREENLRSLELRFHNLQSLYDTYVSETEIEGLDPDLPILRGHISVVFHLLKTATSFAHYYERHISCPICGASVAQDLLMNPETLLATLMNYSIAYAGCYIGCAQRLCQTMLRRYAEVGRIEAPVPRYRGFHVRPSTLISKIVLHYGSDVQIELNNQVYDAGSPLEIFRVNEEINACKRRCLAEEIVRLNLVPQTTCGKGIMSIVWNVVLTLAERSKLVLYEQPLKLDAESCRQEGTPLERVIDEIARLLAIGKIDIATDMTVVFVGDKRVLADIKLLAESGYGEDNFGNNVPLPKGLAYLGR